MADIKLDRWEKEPLWLKVLTPVLRKKRFPVLSQEPECGKWYRIPAQGCCSANGEAAYADYYQGSENKLIVFFQGGGLSINAYTAARPASAYSRNMADGFYMIHTDLFSDLGANKGILEGAERNPFWHWSKIVFPYDTGDLFIGNGDFGYTALDGSSRLLHHHGYQKFQHIMETVKKLVPAPEDLLIAGCSAGGFGAALLSEDILDLYPKCENVTTVVDSGLLLLHDWQDVARNVWHAPEHIVNRIHSNNITLDALQSLWTREQSRIRILFSCSIRDAALANMQNYFDHGEFAFSRQAGDAFQSGLRDMCRSLQQTIPGAGLFLFNKADRHQKKAGLSVHCIIGDRGAYDTVIDGFTACRWVYQAVHGNVCRIGLDLPDHTDLK